MSQGRAVENITVKKDAEGRTIVCQGDYTIARMYAATDDMRRETRRHKLVFEVVDTGDACFDLALAVFRHQRSFGCLPFHTPSVVYAAQDVIDGADDEGCEGDLVVTNKSAVIALAKAVGVPFSLELDEDSQPE